MPEILEQVAARTVWEAVKTPGKLALLLVGNVAAQCFYAGSLLACLAAFGQSVSFWTLLALNIGISLIASLVPLPGGGTAVAAIGLAGMLTAFGVPESATAAAVLAHQLAVSYVPAIPGWFATRESVPGPVPYSGPRTGGEVVFYWNLGINYEAAGFYEGAIEGWPYPAGLGGVLGADETPVNFVLARP